MSNNTLFQKLEKIKKVDLIKFVKYNFLIPQVKRAKGAYIIPFKGAILEIDKTAKLILNGTIHFGINQLKGSRAETYVRLAENSKWICEEDVLLFFGTFIDVHRDAMFESKFFSANTGSVIVVGKHISLGHDVMMGRNIVIYDSDFHSIPGNDGNPVNFSKDVIIEDHVWLTNNVTVLKGVTIGKDSLISAMSLIRKNIPEKSLVAGIPGKVLKDNACWSREYIHDYERQFWK